MLSRNLMAAASVILCTVSLATCAPASTSQMPVVVERAERVHTDATVLRVSFIVNFRTTHVLGQAQALERAGRHDEAAGLVAAALRDDATLHGLCFERFTLGGAEIVLSVCAPTSLEDSFLTQRHWLEHLGSTPGIIYVERNLVAYHDKDAAEAVAL